MRRAQKRQAEDFVKLLAQAHDEIRKEIGKKNRTAAMDLLAQCQEGAVQLGNLIEKTEGEEATTIPLLEAYCELVYRIYEEINCGTDEGREEKGAEARGASAPVTEMKETEVKSAGAPVEEKKGTEVKSAGAPLAENRIYKKLRKALLQIENSIRNDIKVRLEVVFFPYKASMWDSLESAWMAANGDPDCDAYVVPIPYYDRNKDGSLGVYHYEGGNLPEYVPVVYYENYRLEERRPDIAYIHNPYDQGNYVTSVEPRFYSMEIKKYTDKLVYIPYYTTTGGMAEGQEQCMAYYYADYIVIQSEKYRKFFDPALPDSKFLAFGSPKFDRIIRMCASPGTPPEEWKQKMEGRKVYFYNTSINGMLGDTARFLKKMAYVFQCFQGREDVCLMWRPHPLLESTFDSLRPEYRPVYDRLKKLFLEKDLGIYDETPDITETISYCDAYIGDGATSVTSLFGMAGKPLFILDNNLDKAPEEDDWRGEIIRGYRSDGYDQWIITQGNKLYHSPENDYHYRYACDLSAYSSGYYYSSAWEIGGKVYVCPANGQDILVVAEGRIERRVALERCVEQGGAFAGAWRIGQYLFLLPMRYPAIVRYDTEKDRVDYIRGYNDVFVQNVEGKWRVGGSCVWNGFLMLASPVDNRILAIEAGTGTAGLLAVNVRNYEGCVSMLPETVERTGGRLTGNGEAVAGHAENVAGKDGAVTQYIWLLPYTGTTIVRWNPETGESREYSHMPAGFQCRELPKGLETNERPFGQAMFREKEVIFSPCWGNMFIRLDRETGELRKWEPFFPVLEKEKNEYFIFGSPGYFLPGGAGKCMGVGTHTEYAGDMEYTVHERKKSEQTVWPGGEAKESGGNWPYRWFSAFDRRLYDINPDTGEYREVDIVFDKEELQVHADGFCEGSDWMQYACEENAFQTLEDFLDGKLKGAPFDRERQLRAYEKIAANNDGTCGEKLHRFVCARMEQR
ncbi:MAG: hypothetical protein HFH87_08345 [Lachnospiraceae bacterium]|nr:hypothetical protein [Lachnospiraceae bacterium]